MQNSCKSNIPINYVLSMGDIKVYEENFLKFLQLFYYWVLMKVTQNVMLNN